MPREVRRRHPLPRNLPQSQTPQRAAICRFTLMDRKRLRKLELVAEGLENAIVDIQDAQTALNERRDKHWRRHSGYGSDDDPVDEEDALETARCDQILQAIMLSDRERIIKFVEAQTKESDASNEERMDLDAAGADFDVLEQYLATKKTRTQIRLVDVYKTFVSEFEAIVKADSLPFLTALHSAIRTHLPTELRNMIYNYLFPADEYVTDGMVYLQQPLFDPDFHASLEYDGLDIRLESEETTTKKSFVTGTEDVHKPGGWLLNPSYVGKDMARDLAEIYYSSYGFSLDMRNLKDVLHEDRTETGFKPEEHIRKKLNIYVSTTRGNGQMEGAWASTDNETEFLGRIYANLRHLLLLSHIREIPIVICISTCSPLWEPPMEGDRRFYNVMEAVREPIYDLIHAGVDLEVRHHAFSSSKTRVISKGPWNFFKISKELWNDERKSHGPSWWPSSNFVTRKDCEPDTLQRLLVQRWDFKGSIDSYSSQL